jgi:hypothetical protein
VCQVENRICHRLQIVGITFEQEKIEKMSKIRYLYRVFHAVCNIVYFAYLSMENVFTHLLKLYIEQNKGLSFFQVHLHLS